MHRVQCLSCMAFRRGIVAKHCAVQVQLIEAFSLLTQPIEDRVRFSLFQRCEQSSEASLWPRLPLRSCVPLPVLLPLLATQHRSDRALSGLPNSVNIMASAYCSARLWVAATSRAICSRGHREIHVESTDGMYTMQSYVSTAVYEVFDPLTFSRPCSALHWTTDRITRRQATVQAVPGR